MVAMLRAVDRGSSCVVETEVCPHGTTQLVQYPVEIWFGGDRYVAQIPVTKTVTQARVNPDGYTPDMTPADDIAKPAP